MKNTVLIIIILSSLLTNCSRNNDDSNQISKSNPSDLYQTPMQDIKNKKYEDASERLEKIIFEFPLSNEGIQSQIM
jgi:DNA uptake lipoprotein